MGLRPSRKRKTMEQKDYYDILGITNDAPHKQVRDAYRKLALLHHPDRNRNDAEAAERMKAINESYAVLSDPQKRKEYDVLKKTYGSAAYGQFRQTHSDQDIFRGSDIRQIFEELSRAFGYRSFEDIFRESYGAGYRTFEFRRPGAFSRAFAGGLSGGQSEGKVSPLLGFLDRMMRYVLKKKWGIELPEKGRDLKDVIVLSPDQARLGEKVQYANRKTGRELSVTIPANTRAGQQLRLKGMGEPGLGGGEAGELYLTVSVRSPLIQKAKDFVAAIRSFFG